MILNRRLLRLLAAATLLLAGCASAPPAVDPAARQALAPTGILRVGVYPDSPVSLVVDAKTGQRAGVGLDLGAALAQQLGVPVQVVEFARVALVLDALKAGQIDFTFALASEASARDMDFTPPLLHQELGYLVMADSALSQIVQIDRPGIRVGVSQGSSTQRVLTREFKSATVVPVANLKLAQDMLRQKSIDAFASIKGILFEMSDELSGLRVLDGRFGLANMAIAIPKGRDAGRSFVNAFAEQVRTSGQLQQAVQRAGLRGSTAVN